jgi:hypothetical protein
LTLCLGRFTLADKMSVAERIRQINAEEARKHDEELAILKASPECAEAQRKQEESDIANECRRAFLKYKYEKIVKESDIVNILQQTEIDLLNDPKLVHGIVNQSRDNTVQFKLLWRKKSGYKDIDETCMKSPEKIASGYGYYFIYAEINLDTETLTIHGSNEGRKTLSRTEWADNRDLIEDTLARSFMDPWYSGDGPGWSIN